MGIKFIDDELIIGGGDWELAPFKFSKILKIGGGGSSPSYEDIVISGNGSVTLTNAKANGLNYVKLFGACEQPQPAKPNLFNGFIDASGSGITVNIMDDNSVRVNGSRTSAGNYTITQTSGDGMTTLPAGTYTLAVYDKPEGDYTGTQLQLVYSGSSTVRHYVDLGSETLYTTFTLDAQKTVLARVYITANTTYDNYIIKPMLVAGSTAPAEYTPTLPCKTNPVAIKCNNGEIKYGATNKNLLDMADSNLVIGYYVNNSGVETSNSSNFYNKKFIPVSASTTYTWSTSTSINYINFMEYDTTKTFIKRTLIGATNVPAGTSGQFTTDDNTAYLLIGSNPFGGTLTLEQVKAVNWQFELGSTATAYVPYQADIYVDGTVETVRDSLNNTATAENLLGLGTTQDVQNITTGDITRNIGYHIFDGTETMTTVNFSGKYGINITSSTWGAVRDEIPMCNYFRGTAYNAEGYNTCFWPIAGSANSFYVKTNFNNIDNFRTWLVDMYNAGTPMIVVYKKATATTESVTPQTLTTKSGDNTVEITQASINNLPLEVSYKGIQEQQGE